MPQLRPQRQSSPLAAPPSPAPGWRGSCVRAPPQGCTSCRGRRAAITCDLLKLDGRTLQGCCGRGTPHGCTSCRGGTTSALGAMPQGPQEPSTRRALFAGGTGMRPAVGILGLGFSTSQAPSTIVQWESCSTSNQLTTVAHSATDHLLPRPWICSWGWEGTTTACAGRRHSPAGGWKGDSWVIG